MVKAAAPTPARQLAAVTRQRDALLRELRRLCGLCSQEGGYYCEVHAEHVRRAERAADRIEAAIRRAHDGP